MGIAGTSYSIQLGLTDKKWAITLLRENFIIERRIYDVIQEEDPPDADEFTNWIKFTVPVDTDPYQVKKTVQIMRDVAIKAKKKKKASISHEEVKLAHHNISSQKNVVKKPIRIAIFIDNSNIFKGFQKYDIKADYKKLKNLITKDRKLEAIFLYEGLIYPISPQKNNWYEELKNRTGYTIKTTFDKMTTGGVFEKKVDINIAVDMISLAYEDVYDRAILVSGDGDFLPVVEKLKDLGKDVEIWAFKYSLANVLMESIDQNDIYYFDDVIEKLKI